MRKQHLQRVQEAEQNEQRQRRLEQLQYRQDLDEQKRTQGQLAAKGLMNENELRMYQKDLEAYLQGNTMSRSFVGQPYNGIASNINRPNLGANARTRLQERLNSSFHPGSPLHANLDSPRSTQVLSEPAALTLSPKPFRAPGENNESALPALQVT